MALKEGEFYCTKWAFGGGLVKVIHPNHTYPEYYSIAGKRYYDFHCKPTEVHTSWESAMQEVERMRTAKIASLEKQIQKVKSKTFTEPE